MVGVGICIVLALVGSLLIIVGTTTVYDLDFDQAMKSPNSRLMGFVGCFEIALKTYGDAASPEWEQFGRFYTIYSHLMSRCIAGRAAIYFFLLFSGIFTLVTMLMSMVGVFKEHKKMIFVAPFVATFTLCTLFAAGLVWVMFSADLVASFMDCSSMSKDEFAAVAKIPGQSLTCMKAPSFALTTLNDLAAQSFVSRTYVIYAGLALSSLGMVFLIHMLGHVFSTRLCADAPKPQQNGMQPYSVNYYQQTAGPSPAPLMMS